MTARALCLTATLIACTPVQPGPTEGAPDGRGTGSTETDSTVPADPFARDGDEPWRDCARAQCWGGVFVVKEHTETGFRGEFVSTVASSEGYPKDHLPGPAEITLPSRLDIGESYALIQMQVGMNDSAAVFAKPWSAQSLAEMTEILHSPQAFRNDARWIRRRQLWRQLRKTVDLPDPARGAGRPGVRVWGEDDEGRFLAIVPDRGSLAIFDGLHNRFQFVAGAALLGTMDRITFEQGAFVLYRDAWRLGRVQIRTLWFQPATFEFVPDPGAGTDAESVAIAAWMHRAEEAARQVGYPPPSLLETRSGGQREGVGDYNRITYAALEGFRDKALVMWRDAEIRSALVPGP